jgi:hypothetical protein
VTLEIALLYCGEALYSAALNNTPVGRATYQWMATMSPGNTVIEITTARATSDNDRIGVLVEQGRGWIAYTEAPGGFWEDYTLIRTLDGREVRWVNCRWVRIPVSREEYNEMRKASWAS